MERGGVRDDDFAEYVSARWPTLVRSALYLGCPPADAEDLAQNALVRAYRSWRKVTAARDPDAYVYRILFNAYAKSRKRRWTGERATAHDELDVEAAPDHAGDVVRQVSLITALAQLPEEQRVVLVLRYYADLSEPQVASVLGVPVGTVKSRAARGIQRLGSIVERSEV